MLPDTVNKRVEALGELSKQGKRINGLFRLMEQPELWLQAYRKLYANKGAVTRGITEVTMDGFSEERAANIIELLKENRYRFKPSRRVYIPKANGKRRPLGIPTGDDKLVQAVARMLLERIYEPIFSAQSHGFRPHRSCHTALEQIRRTWTGVKGLIEVDIRSFFDNIDHQKMTEVLEKRIDDPRFINLIKVMLRAGYLEDWVYHGTYSGTPQGGVISPLLANIYLHELDSYMAEMPRQYDRGKRRAPSREYRVYTHRIFRLRRKIEEAAASGEDASAATEALRQQIAHYDQLRKGLACGDPFDPGYRRLLYGRYADDTLIGLIGPKDEAEQVMEQVKSFIKTDLHLTIAEEKSGIHAAKDGVTFLGYNLRTYDGDIRRKVRRGGVLTLMRTVAGQMQLHVPQEKVMAFCQRQGYGDYGRLRAMHKAELLRRSDAEIILAYNAELRGFANYYCLAYRAKRMLGKLTYIWLGSLLKTLASKHQATVSQTAKQLKKGTDFIYTYEVKGKPQRLKVFSMKELKPTLKPWATVDITPNVHPLLMGRTELLARLNARRCESGTLPDWRARPMKVESRMI